MAGLLPSKPDISASQDGDPRVIGVDSDDADDLLAALSSTTARELLAALHDEPMTASAVANAVDTSLQNAQYHLEKLERAEIIRVVDTAYSEKGREMNVYAPSDQPLVVFAGREEQTVGLKSALSRLLGSLGILGLASLAIQQVFGGGLLPKMGSSAAEGGDSDVALSSGGTPTPSAEATSDGAGIQSQDTAATVTEEAVYQGQEIAESAGQAAGLPPGIVFFAGGALVICLVFGWWYLRVRDK